MKIIFKNIFLVIAIFAFTCCYSQSSDLKDYLKTDYKIYKNSDTLDIVFPKDSKKIVDKTVKTIDTTALHFLNDFDLFSNSYFLKKYKKLIFGLDKNVIIHQWSGPVIVYFDKKIPKPIIEDLKVFINSFPNIKNLDISITNNINEANYLFKVSSKDVTALTEKQLSDYTEAQLENYPYYKIIHDWHGNKNYKLYVSTLTISQSFLDNHTILDNLKKVFFISLLQAKGYTVNDDTSILYRKNKGFKTLGAFDIVMLKYHYKTIYKFKVDFNVFTAMENYYKKLNNE